MARDLGFVYLVEAKGFHGILSPIRKRRKIGLTNSPDRRLEELNGSQSPCPIVGIRYIQVWDNAEVERSLHKKFAKNRKHGEWFDFWLWELPLVAIAYERKAPGTAINRLSFSTLVLLAISVLLLSGAVVLSVRSQSDIKLERRQS